MKLIGEYYLYDNQLHCDYLILGNRIERSIPRINSDGELSLDKDGFIQFDKTGDFRCDLPYEFSETFNVIYNLDKNDKDFKSLSEHLIHKAAKYSKSPIIKLEIPLQYKKISSTHMPNYNGYEIWYDEKNGDLGDYELAFTWNLGQSQASVYRLYEYKK